MSNDYKVTIFTEGTWSLGKSLNITLKGTKKNSEPISYSDWLFSFIQKKCEWKCSADLGELVSIQLGNGKKGWNPLSKNQWYHEKVVVEYLLENPYTFPIHQSISDHEEHFFREGKEYKPEIPHCLKADSLPVDEVFQSLDFYWNSLGFLSVKYLGWFFNSSMKNLGDVENLHKKFRTNISEYVMQNWKEDSFFGSQFLNGLNPMMIRRIQSLPEKFPVENHMVFPDGDDTLESEMEKGHIFLCDYSILDGVETNTINGKQQYLTAPLVLLHKNHKDEMMPIAIQLKQKPGEDNPIFLPSDSEWDWLLAKLYVRSADFNLHELNYHLLRTHLLAEVFAVALKRNLPRVHPVYKILIRHTRYTLQINVLARQSLISKNGVFTKFTASGGNGTDTILQRSLSNLTYTSLCIPDDIKERGLEDVKNFHYRDDGLKLWDIIFVKETLSDYYKKDSDVEDDKELQEWIQEIFEHGFLGKTGTGIPQKFKTKEELFKFVTMVMFTCSAQHAAVNSGQIDIYGWLPNGPSTMQEPPPTKKKTANEATIMKTLPGYYTADCILATLQLLSKQASDSIFLPDFKREYFTEKIPCENIRIFQEKLNKLSEEIQERNKGLDLPYTYLDPKQVENSVSI
uniref:Lipoxygenase domain-containing protein n=2 Tax=Oryzias TaxID=8089 RepID=A0A3P9IVQ6_ORYLA